MSGQGRYVLLVLVLFVGIFVLFRVAGGSLSSSSEPTATASPSSQNEAKTLFPSRLSGNPTTVKIAPAVEPAVEAPPRPDTAEATTTVDNNARPPPAAPAVVSVSSESSPASPSAMNEKCTAFFGCVRKGFDVIKSGNDACASVEQRLARTLIPGLKVLHQKENRARKDMVMVDIGVNDGSELPLWFSLFGEVAQNFLFFEPQSRYQKGIKDRIATMKANDQRGLEAYLFEAGIGREAEHGKTFGIVASDVFARVIPQDDPEVVALEKKGTTVPRVNMVALKNVMSEKNIKGPIAFLKLDAEGADAKILKSLETLFCEQQLDVAIFELNEIVRKFDVQIIDVIRMGHRCKYSFYLAGVDHFYRKTYLMRVDETLWKQWPIYSEEMVAMPTSRAQTILEGSHGVRIDPSAAAGGSDEKLRAVMQNMKSRKCRKRPVEIADCVHGDVWELPRHAACVSNAATRRG